MPRPKRGKTPLIDWAGRRSALEALRECYRLGDRLQDLADEREAQEAHRREVGRCLDALDRHPHNHPKHAAARRRLTRLHGRRHELRRRAGLALRRSLRRTMHEIEIGMAPVIDGLFVVVFNAAALLLLFGLLSLV